MVVLTNITHIWVDVSKTFFVILCNLIKYVCYLTAGQYFEKKRLLMIISLLLYLSSVYDIMKRHF